MRYRRMPIEIESPEERGYGSIRCNLTESSFRDQRLGDLGLDLDDLVACYGDHRGAPAIREVLADDAASLQPDHVLTTPGAAAGLFMIATALLEPGDHAVVVRTNYATNIETPRLIGADVSHLDLSFDDGFALDVDRLRSLVQPGRTRLISVTYPHNPTGVMIDLATLDALIEIAETSGARLLVDETYREMSRGEPLPVAAGRSPAAVSVSSLSKTYGLPGIRLGWVIASDPDLNETLLAAKEQIFICTSGLDEAVATHVLEHRSSILPPILSTIAEQRDLVMSWLHDEPGLECVDPSGGCVCFPRLVEGIDVEAFYRHSNASGTFVGEGHWFEVDRRFFRLGFGWPGPDELTDGLAAISAAIDASS